MSVVSYRLSPILPVPDSSSYFILPIILLSVTFSPFINFLLTFLWFRKPYRRFKIFPSFPEGSVEQRTCLPRSLQMFSSFTWVSRRTGAIVQLAFEATSNKAVLFLFAACRQFSP